ncbi:uncharacterized protein ATC70_005855 [Mucor velutinosus]|uniref:Kelch repeat protein n=1 Tax=Mucor velutinosus TaxID=708070 RepID=A0AAN7DB20_9FUNG|nr:hypothetical protein ATC70_005855 [Mucor velutinosus]
MSKRFPATLCLALILSLTTTTLAQTAARANTCCGLMSGKIYCYGGLIFTSTTENKVDNVMNVLDITNKSGIASDDLQNLWRSVSYIADNVDLTPRTDPQCIVISDQNRMIVNGGYVTAPKALANMNVMYNALENKWYIQSAYAEDPYGNRQIYWGSGSYVPGKGAAFYGGFEEFINPNWTTPNTNTSIFTFADGFSRTIGYTQVSYFNVDNPASAWNTPVPLTTASDQFSARHQSVFDPVTNMLLFMGGEYRTTTSQNSIPRPYSYIKAFNTLTNEWSMMNLTGDIPTQSRIYSTLTLLPSTNRHVLLYGGEADDTVVQDYCNVLNLDTKNWTRQTIDAPAGTTLQRSRHSSVLVNNNTLFVMWGIDPNKVGTSSVLILNTTNPDAITMSNKYVDPNAANAAEASNGNTIQPGAGTTSASVATFGLSSGAKAGVAVAAVVVVILGAIVIWFYLRNKKKNERIRKQEHELTKQQQQAEYYNTTNVEPMEVDWDQIETKYTEMPTIKLANNNERFGTGPDSVTSTTIINGGEPNSTAYAVHPDAVEVHRPNTVDLPPQLPRVLKPDGGY